MNPCDPYRDSLAAYSPEGEEDRDLARHLESCPDCQREFQSYLGLMEELKDLKLPDPGDLFFQSQLRNIQSSLREASPKVSPFRRWGIPSLALAAAVVLLFIGFSRFPAFHGTSSNPDWKTALQYMADDGLLDSDQGVDLDELNPEQLDRLAKNMENRILQEEDGDLPDENGDLDDLSGPELDRLLQLLNDTSTRRNHEA